MGKWKSALPRSEEHTSELQSQSNLVCRLLLEKKKTADQIAIRDMVRGFAAEKIAPFATKWDEEKTIPRDVLKDAAGLGLAGITVREDQGGSGLSRVESALIFEVFFYTDPATAEIYTLSLHDALPI